VVPGEQLSEQMDDRVVKGVQWMDTQIRFLIAEIQKRGEAKGDTGRPVITFGALFAATIDTMPALAAAIATAKKRSAPPRLARLHRTHALTVRVRVVSCRVVALCCVVLCCVVLCCVVLCCVVRGRGQGCGGV
jgi:hypothetical protein